MPRNLESSDTEMKPLKKHFEIGFHFTFATSIRNLLLGLFLAVFPCQLNAQIKDNSVKTSVPPPAIDGLSRHGGLKRIPLSSGDKQNSFRSSSGKVNKPANEKQNTMRSITARQLGPPSQFTGSLDLLGQGNESPAGRHEEIQTLSPTPSLNLVRENNSYLKQDTNSKLSDDSSIFSNLNLTTIAMIKPGSVDAPPKDSKGKKTPPKNFAGDVFSQLPTLEYGATCGPDCRWHQAGSTAADFCYQPLYWEEINLERHGVSGGRLQPLISGVRFFGKVPLMPYKMTLMPPAQHFKKSSIYPAGLPAPWVNESYEFSKKAGLVEGLSVGALFLIFP